MILLCAASVALRLSGRGESCVSATRIIVVVPLLIVVFAAVVGFDQSLINLTASPGEGTSGAADVQVVLDG